jgi:protein AroM
MLPLARQVQEFHVQGNEQRRVTATHCSPYSTSSDQDVRLEDAAREVAACDLVVMHCMGYSEAMRARVAAAIEPPVLLARRMVAGAIQQLI